MSRILFALLLCCLGLAWAEGEAVNDKDIAAGEEDLAVSGVVVKREAVAAANKKKAKKSKSKKLKRKKTKRKASKDSKKRIRQGKATKRRRKQGTSKSNKKRGQKKSSERKRHGRTNKSRRKKSSRKSKKGQKSKKKNSKERKRKSSSKRKSNRKSNKKGAGKTKQKGKKQIKFKAERVSKSKARKVARQATNYTSCVEKFIEYSRINELKARSVEMQVNRINGFKGIQDRKKGKKGNFQGTYNTLLSALGGNESAPECDGKPINGTSRNAKYKDTLNTLKDCETSVEKICNYELNTTYNSTLQGCLAAAKMFKSEFKNCFSAKKSSAEACTCADAIDTDNLKKLKACDTKAESDKIKASKKACIKGFIKCKTAQDDSVDGVGSCKKVNKCGGAPNKTEAARLLKILKPLSDALANTGFADALKKAGLNSGAGSDGKLPTRLTQLRMARMVDSNSGRQGNNTDGQGCKDIEAEWKNFNSSGDKAVPGVDGDVDEAATKDTITSLDKLNNRKTLDADLASCAKEDSRQVSVTITIIRIRFYVFWCGWFQVAVVEIKITIITITFGLPPSPSPPSPTPAPAPVATSAPGGGRHNIAKHIMNRAALVKK